MQLPVNQWQPKSDQLTRILHLNPFKIKDFQKLKENWTFDALFYFLFSPKGIEEIGNMQLPNNSLDIAPYFVM